MAWTDDVVRVRVPATSANLGPGFDALGLALTLHDEVDAWIRRSGLSIEISGEGADLAGSGRGRTWSCGPCGRRSPSPGASRRESGFAA